MTNPLKTMSLEDSLRLRAERAEAERDQAIKEAQLMKNEFFHSSEVTRQCLIRLSNKLALVLEALELAENGQLSQMAARKTLAAVKEKE